MKQREKGRQIALQALFQLDVRGQEFEADLVEFLRSSTTDPEVYFFARRLAEGAWGWRAEADRLINQAAEHWQVDRMATLDRNILRLATYEICQCPDTPDRVALDQAIELAKRFGSAESGAFVNGILDRILHTLKPETAKDLTRPDPATDAGAEQEK